MFFSCHRWSRTTQERGEQTKQRQNQNLRIMVTAKSISSRQFAIARSMQESRKTTHQASIIQSYRKATQMRKTPESQYRPSNILVNTFHNKHLRMPIVSSPPTDSAPWQGLQPSLQSEWIFQARSKSEADILRVVALASALKGTEIPVFYLAFGSVSIEGKIYLSYVTLPPAHSLI